MHTHLWKCECECLRHCVEYTRFTAIDPRTKHQNGIELWDKKKQQQQHTDRKRVRGKEGKDKANKICATFFPSLY